jgi:hypothetical protein
MFNNKTKKAVQDKTLLPFVYSHRAAAHQFWFHFLCVKCAAAAILTPPASLRGAALERSILRRRIAGSPEHSIPPNQSARTARAVREH